MWEFYRGKTLNVPPSYGILHHYRVCEFGGMSYSQNDFFMDQNIQNKYKDLVINYTIYFENILHTCNTIRKFPK